MNTKICKLIGIDPFVAKDVVMNNAEQIKKRLNYDSFADKLAKNKLITEIQKNMVLNQEVGLSADQRMDMLLTFVGISIEEDGEDFFLFTEIMKQEGPRASRLAESLLEDYEDESRLSAGY